MATVTVDDNDPSISYSDDWALYTDEAAELNGTSHGVFQKGATAVLSFNGSAIDVYGTMVQGFGQSVARYTIDGVDLATTSGSPGTTNDLFRQLFFHSPPLDSGLHTLTVTFVHGNSLWLDYFNVAPNPSPDPKVSTKTTIGTTIGMTMGTTTAKPTLLAPISNIITTTVVSSKSINLETLTFMTTAIQSPSSERRVASATSVHPPDSSIAVSTPSSSSSPAGPSSLPLPVSRSSRTPVGAIVGGAAGGIFVLVIMLYGFWYVRRRRKAMSAITPLPFGLSSRVRPLNTPVVQQGEIASDLVSQESQTVSVYVTRGGTAAEKLLRDGGTPSLEESGGMDASDIETGSFGDVPPPYGR
ncbi:hypothetical protein Hypma_001109 [Hypsizygus marmoreus]|uniref:Uncharacterized protein n=1 Tax=Hypsizygus marmoreus TaxID=39966 RepID=A0A369JB07_HYPMA|nr:hypothetical protein Hypma_001109 [Hypsizygus marmoreus]